MDAKQRTRCMVVTQGTCSINTHHEALLIVPQETNYFEDIDSARVYGVESAEEVREVLELPDCWEPAGEISGEEYRTLVESHEQDHSFSDAE